MIQVETMPSMDTLMDRQKLVGWIVRDQITNRGMAYSEAARRWPISLPTLNRLMNTGDVGLRFYALAEINLELPRGLLELVIDGNVDAVRALTDLGEPLRTFILRELGDTPEPPAETKKPRRRA